MLFIYSISDHVYIFFSKLWNVNLALEAQSMAEDCDPKDDQGQNYYYNVSKVAGHLLERLPLDHVVDEIVSSVRQVCFAVVYITGCELK